MKKDLKEALTGEVIDQIEGLDYIEPGSEEHSRAVTDISKLLQQLNEGEKLENDISFNADNIDYQLNKLDEDRKSADKERKFNLIGTIAKGALEGLVAITTLIVYDKWMKDGFEFEKEGTYTSTTFRNFFSKVRPKK